MSAIVNHLMTTVFSCFCKGHDGDEGGVYQVCHMLFCPPRVEETRVLLIKLSRPPPATKHAPITLELRSSAKPGFESSSPKFGHP
jgi:hypothetical protein